MPESPIKVLVRTMVDETNGGDGSSTRYCGLFTVAVTVFASVLCHCWLGNTKGIWPVKS